MRLEEKLLEYLKLHSQESLSEDVYFLEEKRKEMVVGDNPELLHSYRQSNFENSYLGKWRITGQREVHIFLSLLRNSMEAFVCETSALTLEGKIVQQIKIVHKIASDRIKGGINGSFSSQDLVTELKKNPRSFQAALYSPCFFSENSLSSSYSPVSRTLAEVNSLPASSSMLYFLPRLVAAAGTIKERESLLRKLTSLQKSLRCEDCDQAIALDEFMWAVDIALKCDKDLLPHQEVFLCADLLAQLVLKDFDRIKEEDLQKVYGIYSALYNLLKAKDLLFAQGENLLTSLEYLRRYFLEKTYLKALLTLPGASSLLSNKLKQDKTIADASLEKNSVKVPFQEWGKYLILSMQVCLQNLNSPEVGENAQEIVKKVSQLFQEGRQVYLQRALREKFFPFYQQASHYAVLNYHLSNRHTHLSPSEALKELLAIQGMYIKENLGDCKDLIDYYKNKKCGSLNWQALSKKGREGLILEVERMADYLLTRGIPSAAYAFYRLGSDLSSRFSSEYAQDETLVESQSVSNREEGVHKISSALDVETFEKSSFTHRRFSLAATDAFEKIIPQELLEKEVSFRKKLGQIREKSATLIKDKTFLSQEEQKECTSFYCDLIKEIFHEGVLVFSTEKTPDYALLGIGSLSRGEMCPFSDIELALIKQEFSVKSLVKELTKESPRLSEWIEKAEMLAQKEGLSFEQALQKHIQKEKECRQTIEALLRRNAEEQIRLEELVHEEVMRQKAAVNNLTVIPSSFLEEMELFEKREKKISLERFLIWKKDQIDALSEKLSPESLKAIKETSTHPETELFYSQLSELFNLSIIALGESPVEFSVVPLLQGTLVSTGFHLDKDNNPLELRATAEEFALRQAQVEEVKSIQNNALRTTVFLTGSLTLHTEYQKTLEQVLNQENLRNRHAEANVRAYRSKSFESLESEEILDVKQDLLRLPVFVFETLCLHYGIHGKDSGAFFHTLDKIELLCEKGLFPSCLKEPFKEFLEFGFYLRFKVHLESGEENDKYLPSSWEKKQILHFHKLLVEPLKTLLDEWGMSLDNEESFDLISRIFFLFAKAYCSKAKDLLERNPSSEKALPYLEKSLLIQEMPEAYFLLGKAYFLQNDFIQASKAWQKITLSASSLQFSAQRSEEEAFYLQKEKLSALLFFAEEQAKTAVLLEKAFPSFEQGLREQTEKSEKDTSPTNPSFGGNSPAFHELFLKFVQAGKTPILQDRLKQGLRFFLEQEMQKGESHAKKSVLEKLQPLYFALPPCYQGELKELLRTTFFDKAFLFEHFLSEEGYPFAAMVKKQRWMQSLSRWKKDKLASGEKPLPLIEGISLEKGYLLGSVAHDLFEGKEFKNAIQWGNRAVTQAIGTHFKKNPESPGDEYAVFLLNHLITGQGSPPVEIMKAIVSKEEHLLLASETVEVEPLHLFFSTYEEYLDRIDKKQFSQMVLMALLTDPEDGKADNYIASYTRDAKGEIQNIRLIGVDNDHVFVKPFVQKGFASQEQLFIKTILFCFDQMKGEFHPEVREEFLRLDPSRVLETWLEGLIAYNKKIESLFSEETLNAYWKSGTLVPFFMHPDQLFYLHEKMLRIQHYFTKGVHGHLELLKRLDAKVGGLYETALLHPFSPKKRFEMLTKEAYQRRAHASFTLTTTAQIKKYTLKSTLDKIAHFKSQSFAPEEGLKALKLLVGARRYKEQAQTQIDNSWEAINFRHLLTVPLQEKMLKEKDWSKAPLSHLAKMEKVPFRKVYLKHCHALQDPDLERFLKTCIHPITEVIEIQTLDLRGCKNLTSKSIGVISKNCSRLQKLNLEETSIGSAKFTAKQLPYLRFISLKKCRELLNLEVSSETLQGLLLDDCSQLKTLSLDVPAINYLSLKGCDSLITCHVSPKTPLTSPLLIKLKELQENPNAFSLIEKINQKSMEMFTAAIHAHSRLKELLIVLEACDNLPMQLDLSRHVGLSFLVIRVNSFETLLLNHMPSLKYVSIESSNLQELFLQGNLEIQTLELGCPELEWLYLRGSRAIGFSATPMTRIDEKAFVLFQVLQNLSLPNLFFMQMETCLYSSLQQKENQVSYLVPCIKLIQLCLNEQGDFLNNHILEILLQVTQTHPSLQIIVKNESMSDDHKLQLVAKVLHKTLQEEELRLSYQQLSTEEIRILAKTLPHFSKLRGLSLARNSIEDEGAVALAKGIANLSELTTLSLWGNEIGDAGAIALAGVLGNLRELTALGLSDNRLGDEAAKALGHVLPSLSQLEIILLNQNKIGNEGAVALAKGIAPLSQLTKLFLWGNEIGDEGVIKLARVFTRLSKLEALMLGRNKIGYEGTFALAKSIGGFSQLTRLSLGGNEIGDKGAVAIAEALEHLSSLEEINLSQSKIGNTGAHALAKGLKSPSYLQKVYLWRNEIGDEGIEALGKTLRELSYLTLLVISQDRVDEKRKALLETIPYYSAISEVYIWGKEPENMTAFVISQGFFSQLKEVYVRKKIEGKGFQAFAEKLENFPCSKKIKPLQGFIQQDREQSSLFSRQSDTVSQLVFFDFRKGIENLIKTNDIALLLAEVLENDL